MLQFWCENAAGNCGAASVSDFTLTLIFLLMCHFEWKYFDSVPPSVLSANHTDLWVWPSPCRGPASYLAAPSRVSVWLRCCVSICVSHGGVVTLQPGLHLSSSIWLHINTTDAHTYTHTWGVRSWIDLWPLICTVLFSQWSKGTWTCLLI